MSRESFVTRQLLKLVLRVVHRPKTALAIALGIVGICAAFASVKLQISTDQDELFSRNVPFFKNYLHFTEDFPENQAGYVILRAKDPDHPPAVGQWAAAADAVTDALRNAKKYVREVDGRIPLGQLGAQGLLFDTPENVRQHTKDVTRLIPLAKLWGESPTFLTRFLGSTPIERFVSGLGLQKPDTESAGFVTLLANSWSQSLLRLNKPVKLGDPVPDLAILGATDPDDLGYYYVPDEAEPGRYLLLIKVFERDTYTSMGSLADVINGIRRTAEDAGKAFPEFQIDLSGRPALEADEMVTTDQDARRSEIVALTAVFIGLAVALRSIWLAVAAELALGVGIGWAFGWATLSVGRLNLLSMVFLIALIGIGMDYLIQVLLRYRRERARRSSPRTIWVAVFKYVAAPINTACLGAAGAFFVAVFTDFRGAAELGIIASGGLLLCLATGYVVLPALLTLLPAKPQPAAAERKRPSTATATAAKAAAAPIESVPEIAGRRSRHWWLVLPLLWALLLLVAPSRSPGGHGSIRACSICRLRTSGRFS